LSLRVSSLYWQVSSPTDKRDCITPLLPIQPTAASLRNDQDLALDLVHSSFKEPVSSKGTFVGHWVVPNQQLELSFQVASDTVTLTVPKLGLQSKPIADLQRAGTSLQGNVTLGDQKIAVHGRFAGSYFFGWLDLSGRPYSFVTELKSSF
jgi:hypothetical protein